MLSPARRRSTAEAWWENSRSMPRAVKRSRTSGWRGRDGSPYRAGRAASRSTWTSRSPNSASPARASRAAVASRAALIPGPRYRWPVAVRPPPPPRYSGIRMAALKKIVERLTKPVEDLDRERLVQFCDTVGGARRCDELEPRALARVAGEVQSVRIVPRAGAPSLEVAVGAGGGG